MFTGLIETLGCVELVTESGLEVKPVEGWSDPIEIGESIAINGTCLTAITGSTSDRLIFDVSPETFRRSSLGSLQTSSLVNLERAVKVNDRLGGHIVQGHVDATGTLVELQTGDQFSTFFFQAPEGYDRYLIDKGSVAVDGISLTVVEPVDGRFSVWIIPATLEKTNLQSMKVGDSVNLEFDLIAKYVEKMISLR